MRVCFFEKSPLRADKEAGGLWKLNRFPIRRNIVQKRGNEGRLKNGGAFKNKGAQKRGDFFHAIFPSRHYPYASKRHDLYLKEEFEPACAGLKKRRQFFCLCGVPLRRGRRTGLGQGGGVAYLSASALPACVLSARACAR